MTASRTSAITLAAALGFAAAPALAETVIYTTTVQSPAYSYAYSPRVVYEANPEYVPPVTYIEAPATYVEAPVTYIATPITVRGSRAGEDALISDDVAYAIASDRRVSGHIGVETERNVTTLTGRVTTRGQADIAARDASAIDGVSEVRNHLRSRVGDY
jgi:hypothetical protein